MREGVVRYSGEPRCYHRSWHQQDCTCWELGTHEVDDFTVCSEHARLYGDRATMLKPEEWVNES